MLINFCRKCLQTSVTCSTISNDGYEITNLTCDSEKGFLAYSCIKPPIHIDFTFIYDIKINHLLIWPSVGAQKSSGFEISVKFANEWKRVSTGFLRTQDSGLFFYRRDVDQSTFGAPPNFLNRYIQTSQSLDRVKHLRLTILRTENSVPAIGRVEVWGGISTLRDKEKVHIANLLQGDSPLKQQSQVSATSNAPEAGNSTEDSGVRLEEGGTVPDSFLDPITCNIMIQPIVLPSGVIIDQSTLEKHGKTEATWGRSLSDPFTGLPLTDSRKPIIASALKARIDKYLLENKDASNVRSLPRLSGHKEIIMSRRNRSVELSEIASERIQSIGNRETLMLDKARSTLENAIKTSNRLPKIVNEISAHKLPIIPMCSKRDARKIGAIKIKRFGISAFKKEIKTIEIQGRKESKLDRSVKNVLSNLQRFDEDIKIMAQKCLENCECRSKIFYKLPCNHIFCRDAVLSIKNSRCSNCCAEYNSWDLERFHGHFEIG